MTTAGEAERTEAWIDSGPVLVDYADHIATITLNRPSAANGMTIDLIRALHDAVMHCHRESRARVVVLRGAGKHFCAGGDVREFAAQGEGVASFLKEVTAYLQIAVGALIRLNAIVVAQINGYAAGGGGLGLACAADIAVAGASARFMAGATRVGMAPDAGASVILPRLVGFRRAAEIMLTNRVVGAQEALEIGLVTKVVADEALAAETLAIARDLACGAPKALAATKRLLWNGVGLGVEACLPEEARTVAELSGTSDAREGLSAVIEKRAPRFAGS
jgi:2-(1,2-epoxy-1,2-dihydrophenyl)acetyl-CoA isomerase